MWFASASLERRNDAGRSQALAAITTASTGYTARRRALTLLPLGRDAPGAGARALHPPAARHDMALDHRVSRSARSPHLHRDGGRTRSRTAPRRSSTGPAGASGSRTWRRSSSRTRRRETTRISPTSISTRDTTRGRANATTRRFPVRRISTRSIAAASHHYCLKDCDAAVRDLELVMTRDPRYDFNRAIGLLAHACACAGLAERADALFRQAVEVSTLSEAYYNYASFLASQGRTAEARDWASRILARKPSLPRYLQRRERPWYRRTAALLKRLAA